jgi:hypothetical protein
MPCSSPPSDFKTALQCPGGPPKSRSIANHVTIQSGRIGVKKAAAQKENRAKVNRPVSISGSLVNADQYL